MCVCIKLKETWLVLEFGPEEIDLGGKTSTGSNGDGGDSNLGDGGGDSAVKGARGGSGSGGDDVGGGEEGRRDDGEFGGNLAEEDTSELS